MRRRTLLKAAAGLALTGLAADQYPSPHRHDAGP